MTTVTMNISLTDDLKAFVDSRIKARGYSSTSEYVRELVRRDEELAKEERFRALIQEGLDSPLLPTVLICAHICWQKSKPTAKHRAHEAVSLARGCVGRY